MDYELRIKDTGVGMSKEFATKVFDAFEREQDENITRIQGTGLGMSIVKSFIDLMDGSIDVKTEKGKGTEFIINLSFKEANPIEENEKKEIYNFKGLKALLVDDNEINSDIATLILQNDGFVVTPAYNGHEAVEIIKNSKAGDYDVIFMDIMMPIMNGYEATNTIRSLENKDLANIPIIAMTANAYANDIKSALDAGMNGHISKPLEIDKMRITIKEVLKNVVVKGFY